MEQNESTIWSDVVQKFKAIESVEDLRENSLSASDYFDLHDVLQHVFGLEEMGTTVIASVKNWCKRNKLKVKEDGIGWRISL